MSDKINKGRVYVITCMGHTLCKIGYTSGDPLKRLQQLQTGNPFKLALVGSVEGGPEVEARAHKKFADLRLEGEWFQVNPLDAYFQLRWDLCDDEDVVRRLGRWSPDWVFTSASIAAAYGYFPEDELDSARYEGRIFHTVATIAGRRVSLWSLTPFDGASDD